MLRFCSRKYFFAFMYSINAVIDICSESNNEEVLNSTFVVVACSFACFRWHPSKQDAMKIIQKMKTATPTQIIATIMLFLCLSFLFIRIFTTESICYEEPFISTEPFSLTTILLFCQ